LPIVDTFINSVNEIEGGGGIISVPCGYGKTVLALYILTKLKVKTLVVVHKEFLMNQWKERIEEFIPEARVGKIQGPVIKTENKDIVLGMLQSISMIEYNDDVFKDFGFVIFDECHHLSAEVFSKAMRKISPKYILGLSATIKRADGTQYVFKWYIGDVVYESPDEINDHRVETRLIQYESEDEKYCKKQTIFNGTICRPKMVNQICEYKERTELVLKYLYKYYDQGRTILILSERRQHLIDMMNEINKYNRKR